MTLKVQKLVVANKTKWSAKISTNPEALKARKINEDERRKSIEFDDVKYSAKRRQEEADKANSDEAKTLRAASPVPEAKEKVYFQCGKCMQKVPCDRKAFQTTSLDARTWCGKCGKSLMAKTYLCHCGVLWYKCREHSNVSAVEGKSSDTEKPSEDKKNLLDGKPQPKVGKPKVKRQEPEDLEGNFKVARRKKVGVGVCEPQFRSSMLSTGLKRKFAHLCQNDGD